jgi:hypothetical protein
MLLAELCVDDIFFFLNIGVPEHFLLSFLGRTDRRVVLRKIR